MVAFLAALLALCSVQGAHAAQARSLPPDVIKKAKAPELVFARETLSFATDGGKTLTARLLVPTLLPVSGRLPLLLVFGGFEEAGRVLELVRPEVPVLVASFDYPFAPPRKFEFPGSLKYAEEAKAAIHDTISGIVALYEALRRRPEVDSTRVTLVGASFGAPFALAAAALEPGFSGVVLVHGFGDVPRTVSHQLLRKWVPRYGIFAYPMAWILPRLGWLYLDPPAPEDSARKLIGSQRVLMISAEADTFIPESSRESLWKALEQSPAKRERIRMPGDHLQPGSEKLISEISKLVTGWMEKVELR